MIEVSLLRTDEGIELPRPANEGDAGLDLRSTVDLVIAPAGGRKLVPVGFKMELPAGTAGLVLPRSGLALNHGVTCLNAPGLIDCGYRGEVAVILVNTDPGEPFLVRRGDRVAQLVIVHLDEVKLTQVSELGNSTRGEEGFGASGSA